MTIAVDLGRKAIKQTNKLSSVMGHVCIYSGYHEVPEESKARISPAFQITNKSETTQKIIPSQPKHPPRQPELPPLRDEDVKINNETKEYKETFLEYMNVDLKFLTTIILLLCTIGAVVVYFPRVSLTLACWEIFYSFLS